MTPIASRMPRRHLSEEGRHAHAIVMGHIMTVDGAKWRKSALTPFTGDSD